MKDNGSAMPTTKLRDQPPYLRDRYGYRRTPKLVWVLAAVVAAVVVVFGTWTALRLANPPVTFKLLIWNASTDHTDITFEVRRSSEQEVECALRIQNVDHHDVGYAKVVVPAGTAYEQQTYSVATSEPAYAAEVLGCAPVGSLLVAQPDFPPGESNPPQPWRP